MTETDRVEAPGYKVKRIEPVIKGSDVQARVFTLAPGEAIPWHYHRQSTDHYFVLEGVVSISTREPEITVTSSRSEAATRSHPKRPIWSRMAAMEIVASCSFRGSVRSTGLRRIDLLSRASIRHKPCAVRPVHASSRHHIAITVLVPAVVLLHLMENTLNRKIRCANREQRGNISCDDLGDPSNRRHHFS